MFVNIGTRIKLIAKIICGIGMLASLIAMVSYWVVPHYPSPGGLVVFLLGLLTGMAGCVVSWVVGYFAYGFGQLIEDMAFVRQRMDMPE